MTRWYRLALASCCLLAAGLRLYKLNDANPWWDEGFTYWLASRDLPGMLLRTAGDTHPPLSYFLYQLWLPLAGSAIYALRFQAVIFGVLAVPVCGSLGRRLGGPIAGAAAALLLAISPFHIWWSQQIRMYALVALLCALSMYLFVKAVGQPPKAEEEAKGHRPKAIEGYGVLVGLGLVNLVGLYTLYFFAALILLEGLFLVWLSLHEARRRGGAYGLWPMAYGLSICLLPCILLLPWLAYFRQHAITFAGDATAALSWPQFLAASWGELVLGLDTGVQAYSPALIGLGVVALGLVVCAIQNSKFKIQRDASQFPIPNSQFAWWLLLVAAGLPLAAYGVTLLPGLFYSPAYQTRYDLPALPALVVLLGWGIGRIWNSEFGIQRPSALPNSKLQIPNSNFRAVCAFVALAAFLAVAAWSLPGLYDARHRTDDYQSLARFVQAYERPGDAIVFDPDWNFHLFLLDYRGFLPWESVPLHQAVDAAWADRAFSEWSRQYRAFWLLQESGGHDAGADHPVRGWLEAHLQPGLSIHVGDRALTLYEPAKAPQRELNSGFKPQFRGSALPGLLGFDQPVDDVRTGDILDLAVYGHDVEQLSIGGQNFTGQAVPGGREFAAPIGSAMPAGRQPIFAILGDGKQSPLSSVNVERRPAAATHDAPPLARAVDRAFGGLTLLTSYQVDPQPVNPGQELSVRLQWRALQAFSANYTVFVHLLDGSSHVVAQRDSQPLDGKLPTIAWTPGQLVDDSYRMILPSELAAGQYQLELGMYLQSTGRRLTLSDDSSQDRLLLGEVMVQRTSQ